MSQESEPRQHPPEGPTGESPIAAHAPIPRHETALPPQGKSPFPLIVGALMALTLVASWVAQGAKVDEPTPPPPASTAAPADKPADKPETPADKPSTAETAPPEGSKDEIAALAGRIDALQGKVEGMSKEAPEGT